MIYSVAVAENLIRAGRFTLEFAPEGPDTSRTALYLGLLSCELSLKSLLENAGIPVATIRECSHSFEKLLALFSACTVKAEVTASQTRRVPATCIRGVGPAGMTIGHILSAESRGASKYPNEVRYGETVIHVPAAVVIDVAEAIVTWSRGKGTTIKAIEQSS
jgi:hypothetical protein